VEDVQDASRDAKGSIAARNERGADRAEPESLREELRTVEEELAGLRAEVGQLRGQFGGRGDGPVDPAENAADLTNVEEQEALIDVLERRRELLAARLEH
jgi:hypothetical protein